MMEFNTLSKSSYPLIPQRSGHTATYVPSRHSIIVVGGNLGSTRAGQDDVLELHLTSSSSEVDECGIESVTNLNCTLRNIAAVSATPKLPQVFGHICVLVSDGPTESVLWAFAGVEATINDASHLLRLKKVDGQNSPAVDIMYAPVKGHDGFRLWGCSAVRRPDGEILVFAGDEAHGPVSRLWRAQVDVPSSTVNFKLIEPAGRVPKSRRRHVAAMHENGVHMFVFGGKQFNRQLDDLWVYNDKLELWTEITAGGVPPTPIRLMCHYPRSAFFGQLASVMSRCPARKGSVTNNDTGATDPNWPSPRTGASGAFLSPTKFVIYGGMTALNVPVTYEVDSYAWVFDLVTGRWSKLDGIDRLAEQPSDFPSLVDLSSTMTTATAIPHRKRNAADIDSEEADTEKQVLVMGGLGMADIVVPKAEFGFTIKQSAAYKVSQSSLRSLCLSWVALAAAFSGPIMEGTIRTTESPSGPRSRFGERAREFIASTAAGKRLPHHLQLDIQTAVEGPPLLPQ